MTTKTSSASVAGAAIGTIIAVVIANIFLAAIVAFPLMGLGNIWDIDISWPKAFFTIWLGSMVVSGLRGVKANA